MEDFKTKVTDYAVRRLVDALGETGIVYGSMCKQVPIAAPEDYGLDAFSEQFVTSADGSRIGLWVKPPADPQKPVYVAFHGRTGHWGFAGLKEQPKTPPDFHDNGFRVKWLQALADSGAGVVAVHTRGFGLSTNASIKHIDETALKQDMEAVDDLLQKEGISPQRTIAIGESLGGAMAAIFNETMHERQRPPAMLALINSFSDMSRSVYDTITAMRMGPVRPFQWASEENLRQRLNNPLVTRDRLQQITPDTHLFIAQSIDDDVVDRTHAQRLLQAAHEKNLNVTFRALANRDHGPFTRQHTSWHPQKLVQEIDALFQARSKGGAAPQLH